MSIDVLASMIGYDIVDSTGVAIQWLVNHMDRNLFSLAIFFTSILLYDTRCLGGTVLHSCEWIDQFYDFYEHV